MKIDIRYCGTCMLNTLITEMNLFGASKEMQDREFTDFLTRLPALCEGDPTPITVQDQYARRLRDLSGYDYYREVRTRDNREMLALCDQVNELISKTEDPFDTAMKFAIFGNLIDPAGQSDKTALDVMNEALAIPLAIDDSEKLKDYLGRASRILYVADNAGEIVMDKLFIDYIKKYCLPKEAEVFYGVRGMQIHNDALEEDALMVGLDESATIVNPGNGYAGAMIEESSPAYREAYFNADLVISKGMGNFESLEERTDKPICFLLVAKCVPIATALSVPRGRPVCMIREGSRD